MTSETTTQPYASYRLQMSGLLVILIILDSMHFVFARLLLPRVSPGISVMYVLGISTVEIGLFALARKALDWRELRRNAGFFLIIGLLIAISTNINYEAVAFIDPGTASLLSQTSILFGLGFGIVWMHDHLTWRQGLGVMLALAGVFVVSFQPGDYLRLGSLLVLTSALMYALHAAITKRHGGDISFLTFFFGRLLFTTLMLFGFSAARGALALPPAQAWPLLILVATVDVVLSRTLYYVALRRLTMSMHTLILTLSPIASIVWALMIFGILPTARQLIGGAGIIAGVTIVSRFRPAPLAQDSNQ